MNLVVQNLFDILVLQEQLILKRIIKNLEVGNDSGYRRAAVHSRLNFKTHGVLADKYLACAALAQSIMPPPGLYFESVRVLFYHSIAYKMCGVSEDHLVTLIGDIL